jgi:cytochrome P450
LVSLNW